MYGTCTVQRYLRIRPILFIFQDKTSHINQTLAFNASALMRLSDLAKR